MDVIGQLLRASLLAELGADEDRASRIRDAAHDFASELVGNSRALVPYAVMAAVDESASPAVAPLVRAEQLLLARWETFRNAFADTPTEILRAITLAAVVEATEGDSALTHAAWYTLRTAHETLPTGRWAPTILDATAQWDAVVQEDLASVWAPPPTSRPFRMPTVQKGETRRIAIKTPLRDRAKELEASGTYTTFSQTLMTEFSKHVNDLIGVSEFAVTEAQSRSVATLREFASTLGTRLRETLSAHEASMSGVRLRSELLWWRQSGVSARLGLPYRDLAPADAAIAASIDLYGLVQMSAPLAVEHLLADLVKDAAGGTELSIDDLAQAAEAQALPVTTDGSPSTLIDAVCRGTESAIMTPAARLSVSRVAVLMFRDLQARRLAATTAPSQQDIAE